MPMFKVIYEATINVEAESQDEAYEIADDADASDFYFQFVDIKEIK